MEMKRRLEQRERGEAGQAEGRDNMIKPELCGFNHGLSPACKASHFDVRCYSAPVIVSTCSAYLDSLSEREADL